jgi:hypothetical protein
MTILDPTNTTNTTNNAKPQAEVANNSNAPKATKRVLPDTSKQPKGNTNQKAKPATILQPIADDAAATRSMVVDVAAKTVTTTFAFKLSEKDTKRYQKTTVFNFDGCSQEEILSLALPTVRIIIQRNLRALGEKALDAANYATVNVKRDIIDAQRQREVVDDKTRAVRALMTATNMSHEMALAIVEKSIKDNSKA